jgi:hypothetical protein
MRAAEGEECRLYLRLPIAFFLSVLWNPFGYFYTGENNADGRSASGPDRDDLLDAAFHSRKGSRTFAQVDRREPTFQLNHRGLFGPGLPLALLFSNIRRVPRWTFAFSVYRVADND